MYSGRDFDPETGIYYYRARYYDPAVGRFLDEDPARDGSNFYGYVQKSPIGSTDPLGLWNTYTHSALYWNALRACLSKGDIWQIQRASQLLDAATQGPWLAEVHSMKAPWEEDDARALLKISNFVNDNIADAQARYLAGDAFWLSSFANALHTITDSTSPMHMRNGHPLSWPTYPNALHHGGSSKSIRLR